MAKHDLPSMYPSPLAFVKSFIALSIKRLEQIASLFHGNLREICKKKTFLAPAIRLKRFYGHAERVVSAAEAIPFLYKRGAREAPPMESTPSSTSTEDQTVSEKGPNTLPNLSKLISFCATGLLISFFLPWAQIAGQNISGFDIQKLGGQQMWLWIIPILSVFSIFAVMTGQHQKSVTGLTGAIPFGVLAYWFKQIGSPLFQILGLGAWLSLIFGLALLVLPHGFQRRDPRL